MAIENESFRSVLLHELYHTVYILFYLSALGIRTYCVVVQMKAIEHYFQESRFAYLFWGHFKVMPKNKFRLETKTLREPKKFN